METISINQIADYDSDTEVVWTVENIMVTFNKVTKKWSYDLLTYNESLEDWENQPITMAEAVNLCEVELPKQFYS